MGISRWDVGAGNKAKRTGETPPCGAEGMGFYARYDRNNFDPPSNRLKEPSHGSFHCNRFTSELVFSFLFFLPQYCTQRITIYR